MNKHHIYSRYDLPPQRPLTEDLFDYKTSRVDYDSKDAVDINKIVERYINDGQPIPNRNKPIFGDFTNDFTLSDVFALRDNLDLLYEQLPQNIQNKYESRELFFKDLAETDSEGLARIFGSSATDIRVDAQPTAAGVGLSTSVASNLPASSDSSATST